MLCGRENLPARCPERTSHDQDMPTTDRDCRFAPKANVSGLMLVTDLPIRT
jgi:hypothetical protein